MSQDWKYADFVSALQRALGNIGRRNGHAAPAGGSNLDPMIHRLLVDNIAASFFNKQRKESLDAVLEVADQDVIIDTVRHVLKHDQTGRGTVLSGTHLAVALEVKRPAQRVDNRRLRSLLEKDGRIPRADLDVIFAKATSSNAPAKSYSVISLHD